MGQIPKIGQLKSRLAFQVDTKTSDDYGGYTTVKSTDFSLWGYMRQISESEAIRSGQELGYNSFEIWVLFQSDMIPTRQHTIVYNSKTYTINGVREVEEKNRWIVLSVTGN